MNTRSAMFRNVSAAEKVAAGDSAPVSAATAKVVQGVARGWVSKRDGKAGRPYYLAYRVGERGNSQANQVSLETESLTVAVQRAKDLLKLKDRQWREGGESKWAKLGAALKMEGQRGWASCAEIGEVYLAAAEGSKGRSMDQNKRAFRLIVEQATGRDWGSVSSVELTRELALGWMRLRQEYQRLLILREAAEEVREAAGWDVALAKLRGMLAGRRAGCVDLRVKGLRRALEMVEGDTAGAVGVLEGVGELELAGVLAGCVVAQREVLELDREMDWARLRGKAGNLPRLDVDTRKPGNATINSMMRQAKAMLGTRSKTFRLGDLELPACVAEFCSVGSIPAEAPYFEPIPAEAYDAMEAASLRLAVEDPEVWRVNQLIRKLGLRSCEVQAAQGSWLERDAHGVRHSIPGGLVMVVRDRPADGFWVKSGGAKVRYLPVDPELAALLEGRTGRLVADTAAGCDRAVRRHNEWLRQWIPDRVLAGHELRKHVGAWVYSQYGPTVAAEFLGHCDPAVTTRHYAAFLGQMPMVRSKDLASVGCRR